MPAAPSPQYFGTPAELRRWFAKHHATASELWVGFLKKRPGVKTLLYLEAVDEALA